MISEPIVALQPGDTQRHLLATEPRARAGHPRNAPETLALHLARDPLRLAFRERETAGERCAARNGQAQAAVLRHAHHIAARKPMARDGHRHPGAIDLDVAQGRRLRDTRQAQSGQAQLHGAIVDHQRVV